MINSFLIWLLESSFGIVVLAIAYRLLLEKLTFFTGNRIFLLVGVALCLVVPLFNIPTIFDLTSLQPTTPGKIGNFTFHFHNIDETVGFRTTANAPYDINWTKWIYQSLFVVYIAGALRQTILLGKGILTILTLKSEAYLSETESETNIFIQSKLPTFSFGHNIFLNKRISSLSKNELDLILLHEKIHVRQKHTYDVLFFELTQILLWFNPCFKFLAHSLKQVHEFIADGETSANALNKKEYGQLLLKLAIPKYTSPLINPFSGSQLFIRLTMLTKPKSSPMEKLKFLSFLPILAIIATLCASFSNSSETATRFSGESKNGITFSATSLKIGEIRWEGNTKFSNDELQKVIGVKSGDAFDSAQIDHALNGAVATGKDLSSLYMDQGFLFFRAEVDTKTKGNTVDITFKLYEGKKAKIGKIIFIGNKSISSAELLGKIQTKQGELFSRKKLMESQQILSNLGTFVPNEININPIPDFKSFESSEVGNVDIEFALKEK